MVAIGIQGKLPSHGDFVRRGVPAELFEPLDAWLAQAVAESRAALGEGWLEAYLEAPVWRFALAAGRCGPSAAAGVWLPSVDRVGRYFPLLLVAALPPESSPTLLLSGARAWYEQIEERAVALLEGRTGLEEVAADLSDIASPLPELAPTPLPWRLPLDGPAAWRLAALAPVGSLWWSDGSPRVASSLLVCPGLPPPAAFAAMLDGGFSAHGWTESTG
jgi:type VI secretion system protein ImpM